MAIVVLIKLDQMVGGVTEVEITFHEAGGGGGNRSLKYNSLRLSMLPVFSMGKANLFHGDHDTTDGRMA